MSNRKRTSELTEGLEAVFALAALVCVAVLGLVALVALVPVATTAAVLLAGYGLAWAAWTQISPPARSRQNAEAAADLWANATTAATWLADHLEQGRRDWNNLVSSGDWNAWAFPRPALATAGETVYFPVVHASDYPVNGGRLDVCYPAEDVEQTALPVIASVPQVPATSDAEDVAGLLRQLNDGWTVLSATVKADDHGRLHVEDVRVETGVSLSPEQPQDMADALRLDFMPEGAFAVEDLPIVAVLPVRSPEDVPAWTEDDLDPESPLPNVLPDDAPEDLPPAASTLAPETVPAAEPSIGASSDLNAAGSILGPQEGNPAISSRTGDDCGGDLPAPQTDQDADTGSTATTSDPAVNLGNSGPTAAPRPTKRRRTASKAVPVPMRSAAQTTKPIGTGDVVLDAALALIEQGRSQREAARELGVSESTLRGKLTRHRKATSAIAA